VARVDAIAYLTMALMLFTYTVIYQESSLPIRTRSWFHLSAVVLGLLGFIWIWVPSLITVAGTSILPSVNDSYIGTRVGVCLHSIDFIFCYFAIAVCDVL